MTLSITTLSKTTLRISIECHFAECHIFYCHAECHFAECRGAQNKVLSDSLLETAGPTRSYKNFWTKFFSNPDSYHSGTGCFFLIFMYHRGHRWKVILSPQTSFITISEAIAHNLSFFMKTLSIKKNVWQHCSFLH